MRNLRNTRQNPIDRDATSELVAYTKKEGGFLRVEYTNSAGKQVTSLLRPESVFLLAHNFRDERGRSVHEDANARRKVDLSAVTKIETMEGSGDLKLTSTTVDGETRAVVVTLDDFYLSGNDFRDVYDQPMGLSPKDQRSIKLAKIDTMAYRAEKDVDPITTGLGGAFAFLNWRYRIPDGVKLKIGSFVNVYDALQAIAFEPETPAILSGSRKQKDVTMVITPEWEDAETGGPSKDAVAVVDSLLSRKFSIPQMRRYLVTTGSRPFLLDGVPENAPVQLQVDQNPILERLRAEAREAQVQPTTPLPSRPPPELEKRITETSIMGDEGLEQAEAALDSLRASTLQRTYWAHIHRDASTPELVPVAVEDFRRDSSPDVDAVIYIQSIRDSSNTPDKVFALLDPPIPYIVLKQPANLLDESGVTRALKWMAEHPDWQRIGIAMVTTDISRKQITQETLLYRDMLQAGLTDPQLREDAASKVEIKYTNDGNVKSPLTGEVLGVRPIATGYEVTISVPAPLERGIGSLVHVSTSTLNAVMLDLEQMDTYLKGVSDPDNTLSKTPANAAIGAAWKQLRFKIERLKSKLIPRQEAAKRRRAIIGGRTAAIPALKQELLDLNDAKDAVMGCLDVLSDHVRLVRRLVELGKLEHSGVTVAEQRAAGTPQMRRWLVASESVPSISAESADPLAVRDMKARLAKINRMIEKIPAELRSASRTDNLRGLAKVYPGSTPGAKYEFIGDELYLYEYLKFPAGRPPLNLKPGQLLLTGDTIILGGKRTDVAPVRVDKFGATECFVITQPRGIDAAPVTVSSIKFGRRITERDELDNELTDQLGEHVMMLRLDALRALSGEGGELLKKISDKLTADNEYNYILADESKKGASFVVDPVFYCILFDEHTGDVWMPPMGSIVPGFPGTEAHNEFVDGVSESPKFGPDLVEEALTKTVPFMSEIPLDVNKPKLLWRPKGEYASAIRSILVDRIKLAQVPGYYEYEKNYFPSSKGARLAKKAGEELSSRLVTMGTYRALGTAGAVLGAEGKMYGSKSSAPKAPGSGTAPDVGTIKYGSKAAEIQPQKYAVQSTDSPDEGGLTIVGARGGKGAPLQQLRMAPAASRFDRYMEKLVTTQKQEAPTARQKAMGYSDAKRQEEREEAELNEQIRLEKEQRDEEIRLEDEARAERREKRKKKKDGIQVEDKGAGTAPKPSRVTAPAVEKEGKWEVLNIRDGRVRAMEHFLAAKDATDAFNALKTEIDWRQDYLKMYGREIPVPRLQQAYGDPGVTYVYSKISMPALPWTPTLAALRDRVAAVTGVRHNFVLCNYYRTGSDSVSWHADDEKELGPNPHIASVSLGAERDFLLKHQTGEQITVRLVNGSLLVMDGSFQSYWQHSIPKTTRPVGGRINLTFRLVGSAGPAPDPARPAPRVVTPPPPPPKPSRKPSTSPRGTFSTCSFITRNMLREAPGTLFVFGDNLKRTGLGGQAAEMRGEPNALGIPTKVRPENTKGSFFSDADYGKVIPIIDAAFSTLEQHLARGGDVVFPADGIGTRRARLPSSAPSIYAHILSRVARLQGTLPAPPPKPSRVAPRGKIVGFTGTRAGMTAEQKAKVSSIFRETMPFTFVHGDCIGADTDAHHLALKAGAEVIMRPCTLTKQRSFSEGAEKVYPSKPPLDRNREIVDDSSLMIATPKGFSEERAGGTWYTIRYARSRKKPLIIVWPDGSTGS